MVDDTTELVPADFGNYISYASYLCEMAKKTATEGQRKAWEKRFLAGCLYLAAPRLPPLTKQADVPEASTSSRTTLRRWAKIASLVNSIVAGLLEFWGDRAYWVYEAVVGMATVDIHNTLIKLDQRQVVSKLVTMLSNQRPKEVNRHQRFNPEKHLCKLLDVEPSLMQSILFPAPEEDDRAGAHASNAIPQQPISRAQSHPPRPNQCPSYESATMSVENDTNEQRDSTFLNTMMDLTSFELFNRNLDEMMDTSLVNFSTSYLNEMMDTDSPLLV